jgi:hypothetical protein
MGPLCPVSIDGRPVALLNFQMAPRLTLLMSSGSNKKEPRYTCLSEAKASHSQRMWAEVSSSAPHLLHNGLSDSPIRWRCLLRVLCPVRRPVTALDWVLLKDIVRDYCDLILIWIKKSYNIHALSIQWSSDKHHTFRHELDDGHSFLHGATCRVVWLAGHLEF